MERFLEAWRINPLKGLLGSRRGSLAVGYLFLLARRILFKRKSSALTASMAVAATIFLIVFNGVVFGGVLNAIHRDLGAFQYGHLEVINEKEGLIDKPYRQVVAALMSHPLVEAAAPRLEALTEVSHLTSSGVKTLYEVRTFGVDPVLESRASLILQSVVSGQPELSKNMVLLGGDLAEDLGVTGPGSLVKVKVKRL
ncbi:hypothetical protein DRO53_01040 [Candidatus Bathyarchaeota archaeon]|nr:MAG: hypothetical protein DRO53_01040 [Candidatus Bathyarchaeota archaeon]